MKKPLLLFVFACILFACQNTPKKNSGEQETGKPPERKTPAELSQTNYLISSSRVGMFTIGGAIPQKAPEGFQLKKTQKTRAAEGRPITKTMYVLSRGNDKILLIKPQYNNQSKIGEIIAVNKLFQTEKGIGAHSTLSEFKQAYPDFTIWYTYVSDWYVLETPELSAQFLLDQDGYTGKKIEVKSEKTPLRANDFKPNTRIEKVRVY